MSTYRNYFDIDPTYFPAVNADVIKKNPDLWKKFYPHDTFVKLVRDVVSVLSRKQKLNVWVEGAYGTGKSHAVLTLKRLLDASEEDTKEYFEQFGLDNDLLNKFLGIKKQGKIVTVHRYGSSSILSDNDLFLAMQESIETALEEAGIDNKATGALRSAVINYLSEEENKRSFEVYVKGSYSALFGGESVDDIIKHLDEYEDEPLATLMGKIFKLANDKNIRALYLTKDNMVAWIKEVIDKNHLHALVFIWDEFSEYFKNNQHRLTGYQEILEISETYPFCFIPVSHQSEALISDSDKEKTKIIGRFVRPYCSIELPENMAFRLMGAAMRKKESDPLLMKEWQDIILDLTDRTQDSRNIVKKMAKIDDKDLAGILPIHPYTAVLLKHIATSFDSNQRSMFDFIKNDRGEEIKGFQWYIDNFGPYDDNPLLTIDMLWSFFYDMGKESLTPKIRIILDYYPRLQTKLSADERRILKAILLMQAMSLEVDDSVDLFIPNEKNLNNAFEGSDMESGEASKCAEKLVRDGILYKKPQGKDKVSYSILTGTMDAGQIENSKKQFETKSTSTLIQEGSVGESIELTAALRLRCKLDYASINDFEMIAKKASSFADSDDKRIYVVATFAKDSNESSAISKKIKERFVENPTCPVVFIDCGKTPLGTDAFAEWVENKATAYYLQGKDNGQSTQYAQYAMKVLSQWKDKIRGGQYVVYSNAEPDGEYAGNSEAMISVLSTINAKRFKLGLECFNVIDNMWKPVGLKQGVGCGLTQKVEGTYRSSNPTTKLETALNGAWLVDNYWESQPSLVISRIKINLDKYFDEIIEKNGRISIYEIYSFLKDAPFGFMPCNLSAFIMGFLLKEQILSEKYTWSDGTVSDELSQQRFKDMVERVIKNDITPMPRYKDEYIVAMTEEEKSFISATSIAFGINKTLCSSVESARERIRNKMKELSFPIWTLLSILGDQDLETDSKDISDLINLYFGIANNVAESGQTDNDIASAIGKKCIECPDAAADLSGLFTKELCTKGMEAYLKTYNGGELLQLAKEINDGGQYINALRAKFDADAANWVWKKETVNQRIEDLICEYKIISESNKVVDTQSTYKKTLESWIDKCRNIRLPYVLIQPVIGELDTLMSQLYKLCINGKIQDLQKEEFLNSIRNYGADFKQFYGAQLPVFKKVCSFYLSGLTDSDIDSIFLKVHTNSFTKDKTEYEPSLDNLVNNYKKNLGSQKLKSLWQEKTGTASPLVWSKQYLMPIMVMMKPEDEEECRKVFSTINSSNPDQKAIEKALSFLENVSFWDVLSDASLRDKAFADKIIKKSRAAMLSDIQSVKQYLRDHITDEPYYWNSSSAVDNKLDELAQHKYVIGGYQAAFNKIDSMDADLVKAYLKDLIKNNMAVGVEIINNKK